MSVIQVDPARQYQAMEGFGASGAWWAQDVGGWEDDKRGQVARLLFDRNQGIGLSIYRYNVGGGDGHEIRDPWRRAETFETGEGTYDWSRDGKALWMLRAARDAGVQRFVAFVNSPPARMTRSGTVSGAATEESGNRVDAQIWMSDMASAHFGWRTDPERTRSNLHPAKVDAFAQYLVDVVRHLREVEGIPVGWISPINEPQWGWCRRNQQEGCHYTPAECATVTRALVRAIRTHALEVKISVVEAGLWLSSGIYMRKLLGDPELAPHLDTFAVHSYQSSRLTKWLAGRYARLRYPHVRLWMSEWTQMRRGRSAGMASALTLANTIHEDLVAGGATSWQYWIAVSKYDFHDGLVYVDPQDHQIAETKRLWAMGNFSRFVRPGDVRIAAQSRVKGLSAIAFRSDARHEICLVVINPHPHPIAARLALRSGPLPVSVTAFETSSVNDLAQGYQGAMPDTYRFAPGSVTTLIGVLQTQV